MFEELINYILDVALHHKAVKTATYKSRDLINQQNNNAYFQYIVEDSVYSQFNANSNTFNVSLNIDILGFVTSDYTALKCQSEAFQIGLETIAYIQNDPLYQGIISIDNYSFLTLSRFTDDNASGQRLSLDLTLINPVDWCVLNDNFDEEISAEKQQKMTLSSTDECTNNKTTKLKQTITLRPKK